MSSIGTALSLHEYLAVSIGLEGLYGIKEAQNGVDSGDHWHVQPGMVTRSLIELEERKQ